VTLATASTVGGSEGEGVIVDVGVSTLEEQELQNLFGSDSDEDSTTSDLVSGAGSGTGSGSGAGNSSDSGNGADMKMEEVEGSHAHPDMSATAPMAGTAGVVRTADDDDAEHEDLFGSDSE
jgi:hypothetical protein